MPVAKLASADIYFETFGDPADPTIVLIAGLGTQLLFFEDEFCEGLVDRAFHVVRFDNRDTGLSSRFEQHVVDLNAALDQVARGETPEVAYTLTDMAGDVAELIEHLDLGAVHLLGVSLGGMVAQILAIESPELVRGLALLSSTTGSPDVGQPTPEAFQAIMAPAPDEREQVIEQNVASRRIWSTPAHWDEAWTREYFARSYDRAPESGTDRQMLAVLVSRGRDAALAEVAAPALVLHGDVDTLIDPSGGERLAQVLPDCEHLVLEGMGHDLPPHYWSQIIEALVRMAIRAL